MVLIAFSAPFLAPNFVTANNSSSTSLIVKWRHLSERYFRGLPLGYTITYHPTDLENNIVIVSVSSSTNITTLANLNVYTMYVINVSAVSSGGVGPANTAKARTNAEGTVAFFRQLKKTLVWEAINRSLPWLAKKAKKILAWKQLMLEMSLTWEFSAM